MANDEHVALLKQGVAAWNAWRDENPDIRPDLMGADLRRANLSGPIRQAKFTMFDVLRGETKTRGAGLTGPIAAALNLSEADLRQANLSWASLVQANLTGANLRLANLYRANLFNAVASEADFAGVDLRKANLNAGVLQSAILVDTDLEEAELCAADLMGADLSRAHLNRANLTKAGLGGTRLENADLTGADLTGATLRYASLVEADFSGADLIGCDIYGVSAWGLKLEGTKQQNLVITHDDEPQITVDDIEVAQFIYLMLNNQKVRNVIDTITSKAVLILGRFTDERKAVLDALREELRKRNYLPILFDFEKPGSRDTVETVTLLARMARFIVADLSDAKAVVQELQAIVPQLPSVPVQPIILGTQEEPGMFDHLRNFRSFMSVYRYTRQEQLIADLGEKVIRPAELKGLELRN